MSDIEAALATAKSFLLQSPPGELNDVYADLVTLVAPLLPGGQSQLDEALAPALRQYAAEQLTVVDLPEGKGKTLLTPVSIVEGTEDAEGRHVAPKAGSTFAWDALKATASALSPLFPSPDADTEALRSALDKLLAAYTANHYAEGASAVFALPDPAYPAPTREPATALAEAEAGAGGTEAETETETETEAADAAAETADAAQEALPREGVETANGEAAPPPAEEAAAEAQAQAQVEAQDATAEGGDAAMEEATPAPAAAEEGTAEVAAPQEEDQAQDEPEQLPGPPSRLFALYLVGNKYNPTNYWTGRWRSTYTLDWAKGTLEGTAQVNIHYYEQGNVQLSTTLKSSTPLAASPPAEAVIAALKASESSLQRQLGETYAALSDTSFRGLRRALPKTRSKVDWDKAASYRLGQQLGGGGAAGAQ